MNWMQKRLLSCVQLVVVASAACAIEDTGRDESATVIDAAESRADTPPAPAVPDAEGELASARSALLFGHRNLAPIALITRPLPGATYLPGQSIAYQGYGFDLEDGLLPASAFTWEVMIKRDGGPHEPYLLPIAGSRSGSFTAPSVGSAAFGETLLVKLTTRDASGRASSDVREVKPRTARVRLQTVPAGLQVTLDDLVGSSPLTARQLVGETVTIGAPSPQFVDGRRYVFERWSDGGAATHDIETPAVDSVYTAYFGVQDVTDVSAAGVPFARVMHPFGIGSRDIEVIRDGVTPAVGSESNTQQFDTYTGQPGAFDFVGYVFEGRYAFEKLVFQEGRHFEDGGWFDDLTVQVRQGDSWVDVSDLTITPAYPSDDGLSYETFTLSFAPIEGTGIRLFGAPGGSADFVSVAELTAFGALVEAGSPNVARLFGATPIARVTEPSGDGSRDLAVIHDGVLPRIGAPDELALQYDTFTGAPAAEDWIGYTFGGAHRFRRLVFQEGKHQAHGGWFDSLRVQVLQAGDWVDVEGLASTPRYPFDGIRSFEQYELTFTPIEGTGIRLIGAPGGSADFISVGELEVYVD